MRRAVLRRLAASGGRRAASTAAGEGRGVAAASALVRGEGEAEEAASRVADELLRGLGGAAPGFTLWFAKGYGGDRAVPIGPLLQRRLGGAGCVVVGSASEGGVVAAGEEAQDERFALAALAVHALALRAYPFHSSSVGGTLPELRRGGSWSSLVHGPVAPCVLGFCTLPLASRDDDPQAWATLVDRALAAKGSDLAYADNGLPSVVGGLPVGNHVYVDGESYTGGCFGVALEGADTSISMDAVVCQGSVPFGPWLEITDVSGDHIITGLNGRNPQEVLTPLINSPDVPGEGHTMAGVFVDPTPVSGLPGSAASRVSVALAALGGRPSCLVRPMHQFTPQGHLVATPLPEALPYAAGMQLQLHCHSSEQALGELRSRAEHDVERHGGRPPDAAVMITCGARGVSLHGKEGVEIAALREVWGRDVPTAGCFAGGELGPVGLKTYMHGYTTSCLVLRG